MRFAWVARSKWFWDRNSILGRLYRCKTHSQRLLTNETKRDVLNPALTTNRILCVMNLLWILLFVSHFGIGGTEECIQVRYPSWSYRCVHAFSYSYVSCNLASVYICVRWTKTNSNRLQSRMLESQQLYLFFLSHLRK